MLASGGISCATPVAQKTLTMEEHSLRIKLTVGADGMASLAEHPPLMGRIDLSPILEAEEIHLKKPATTTVQLMMHYGRVYVVADSFRAIWEFTPRPGTSVASFRPIPVVRGSGQRPMKNVRLSRYGSSRSSCVRLDRADGSPVFITTSGEASDDCP